MFYKKFSEIKVGIFVFVAVAIVTSTIFWAKGYVINKDRRELTAYFENSGGLNFGDPVIVNGVKKGKITAIDLEGDSVLVTFNLEKDVKIKKDYVIVVTSLELMAGKALSITPGKDKTDIEYDKPLRGSTATDIMSLISGVASLSGDVKELISKFNNSADKLDILLTNVNELVGDPALKNDLKSTVANLSVASRNLNFLVNESRSNISDLTKNADKTLSNINSTIDENSPELVKTISNIQTLTVRFDSLFSSLNSVVSDIKNRNSGVGKFLYDDKFFDNLNNTLNETEKLIKQIRKDGVKINLF